MPHLVQVLLSMAPVAMEYVPGSHLMQLSCARRSVTLSKPQKSGKAGLPASWSHSRGCTCQVGTAGM